MKRISTERKTAYYLGMILVGIGFLLFFSVFITGAANFGDFSNFESEARSSIFRAVTGVALIIIGGILRGIGAKGLAGSGVVLNPGRARSELEPFSRMTGGIVKDVLEEADVELGGGSPETVVKIRCRECGKLNEEDSKFCQECGKQI